jgi:asparaginyl-tRNA synthetase
MHKVIRLQSYVLDSVRSFFKQEGVVENIFPCLTRGTGACENTSTVFKVEHSQPVFLAQTKQLDMEAAIIKNGISAQYVMGASFRKEPRAGDGRHLAEFTLIEFEAMEMDLAGLCSFQERMLAHVLSDCLAAPPELQEMVGRHVPNCLAKRAKWPIVTYDQVIESLNSKGVSINWGDDLRSSEEQFICFMFDMLPVQVTHFPEKIKFFNMMLDRDGNGDVDKAKAPVGDRQTVACVDLLLPYSGETFGGSEREYDYDILKKRLYDSTMLAQLEAMGGTKDAFSSYLDLFKADTYRRSGFGLGFGRLLQFIMGVSSINETLTYVQ